MKREAQHHSIHTLKFNFNYRGAEEDLAAPIQLPAQLLLHCKKILITELDKIVPSDVVLRIEKLEIEVDTLNLDQLSELFAKHFRTALKGQLKKWAISGAQSPVSPPSTQKGKPIIANRQNALFHFLQNGRFPWWYTAPSQEAARELFKELLGAKRSEMISWIRNHQNREKIWMRIGQLAETSTLKALIEEWMPGLIAPLQPYLKALARMIAETQNSFPFPICLQKTYAATWERLAKQGFRSLPKKELLTQVVRHLTQHQPHILASLSAQLSLDTSSKPALTTLNDLIKSLSNTETEKNTPSQPEIAKSASPLLSLSKMKQLIAYFNTNGSLPDWAFTLTQAELEQQVQQLFPSSSNLPKKALPSKGPQKSTSESSLSKTLSVNPEGILNYSQKAPADTPQATEPLLPIRRDPLTLSFYLDCLQYHLMYHEWPWWGQKALEETQDVLLRPVPGEPQFAEQRYKDRYRLFSLLAKRWPQPTATRLKRLLQHSFLLNQVFAFYPNPIKIQLIGLLFRKNAPQLYQLVEELVNRLQSLTGSTYSISEMTFALLEMITRKAVSIRTQSLEEILSMGLKLLINFTGKPAILFIQELKNQLLYGEERNAPTLIPLAWVHRLDDIIPGKTTSSPTNPLPQESQASQAPFTPPIEATKKANEANELLSTRDITLIHTLSLAIEKTQSPLQTDELLSQLLIFLRTGNLPSQPPLLEEKGFKKALIQFIRNHPVEVRTQIEDWVLQFGSNSIIWDLPEVSKALSNSDPTKDETPQAPPSSPHREESISPVNAFQLIDFPALLKAFFPAYPSAFSANTIWKTLLNYMGPWLLTNAFILPFPEQPQKRNRKKHRSPSLSVSALEALFFWLASQSTASSASSQAAQFLKILQKSGIAKRLSSKEWNRLRQTVNSSRSPSQKQDTSPIQANTSQAPILWLQAQFTQKAKWESWKPLIALLRGKMGSASQSVKQLILTIVHFEALIQGQHTQNLLTELVKEADKTNRERDSSPQLPVKGNALLGAWKSPSSFLRSQFLLVELYFFALHLLPEKGDLIRKQLFSTVPLKQIGPELRFLKEEFSIYYHQGLINQVVLKFVLLYTQKNKKDIPPAKLLAQLANQANVHPAHFRFLPTLFKDLALSLPQSASNSKTEVAPALPKNEILAAKLISGILGEPDFLSVYQKAQLTPVHQDALKAREKAESIRNRYPWQKSSPLKEKIFIDNAGLVILWPFFTRFFKHLGFLEEGAFKDQAAQHRAVFLLQYLVDFGNSTAKGNPSSSAEFYEGEVPEFALVLNKLICGIPLDQPITLASPLTSQEKEHAHHLIKAATSNWIGLQGTSVEGFQRAFLQREGILVHKEDIWNLKVDKKSIDVLMKNLNWGISIINLSFNPITLYVEWN